MTGYSTIKMKLAANSLFLTLVCFSQNNSFGQVFDTIYDLKLNPVPLKEFANSDFLILSRINCFGCVQHSLNSSYGEKVIIITENMSLYEVKILPIPIS